MRNAKALLGGNVRMRRIYKDGSNVVRIRQPGRNDDASRRVAPENAPDLKLRNESCGQVFPSRVRDACGRHDSSGHNQRAVLQMALIHRDDVVRQISPTAFDPAIRYTILPRTFAGGPHRTHPQRSNGVRDFQSVFRIPVEDPKPGSRLAWKRLPQLLDDPPIRRMTGDVAVQDASTIVADHEEAVGKAESDRGYGEEVHRRNDFPMISKETEPTSCRLRISWRSFHLA
jgi:hypothetical protein